MLVKVNDYIIGEPHLVIGQIIESDTLPPNVVKAWLLAKILVPVEEDEEARLKPQTEKAMLKRGRKTNPKPPQTGTA